jgi:phosphorylcholine metabolism protein LicD
MMPRNDYNRLSELWEEEAGSDFIIQDKAREQNYTQNFMKIRKDNTAYVQQESELFVQFCLHTLHRYVEYTIRLPCTIFPN